MITPQVAMAQRHDRKDEQAQGQRQQPARQQRAAAVRTQAARQQRATAERTQAVRQQAARQQHGIAVHTEAVRQQAARQQRAVRTRTLRTEQMSRTRTRAAETRNRTKRPVGYRPAHFERVHARAFHYPRGYHYRRWSDGSFLPRIFLSSAYYYTNWYDLGFGPPPPGYQWVRYGPDLLLVNVYTGRIRDVAYNVFY
jgi:Ni/Co efflux regulator RcnB